MHEHDQPSDTASPCPPILLYLARSFRSHPEAEVPGQELQRELRVSEHEVRDCARELARHGLVECDLLLHNLWFKITDGGLAVAEHLERLEHQLGNP
jgi:hypothetical protein